MKKRLIWAAVALFALSGAAFAAGCCAGLECCLDMLPCCD